MAAAAKPLDTKAVTLMASKMAAYLTKEKIQYSKRTIRTLIASGRFPEDDDYRVYLGRSLSARTRNAEGALQARTAGNIQRERIINSQMYKSPAVFFNTMSKRPYDYGRPWIFRPTDVGSFEDVVKAVNYINSTVRRFYNWNKNHPIAKRASGNLLLILRGPDDVAQVVVSGVPSASQLTAGSELILVNPDSYAALTEALSVEKWKTGGVMYQAAKLGASKFRTVDISFTYTNLQSKRYLNLALPQFHDYMVPVIRIAMRGGKPGRLRFSKPGRNIRRGTSPYSSKRQRDAKANRDKRRQSRRMC